MADEKKVPTITIRVVNREKLLIEVSKEFIPTPDYALAMVDIARRAIDSERQDLEAISFQQKMQQAAEAQRAMRTGKIIF